MPAAPPRRRRASPLTDEPLMDVSAVATYLGVKPQWIYNNWKAYGIPMHNLGGPKGNMLRCRPDELAAWIEGRRAA